MNDNLTVQCVDTARLVLLRAFAHQVARDLSEQLWSHLIQEGSSRKRLEYCLDCKISLRYLRAIQGHCGGIPKKARIDGIHTDSAQLERVHLSLRNFVEFSIHFLGVE